MEAAPGVGRDCDRDERSRLPTAGVVVGVISGGRQRRPSTGLRNSHRISNLAFLGGSRRFSSANSAKI